MLQMKTISNMVLNKIQQSPDFIFLKSKNINKMWNQYSFKDLHSYMYQSREILKKMNVKKGDRVAFKGNNSMEWITWSLATNSLGAVWVPMYTNQNKEYCNYIIQDSEPTVFLTNDVQKEIKVPQISYDFDIHNFNIYNQKDFNCEENTLNSLIYTSGTTGSPKGVMLSNENIISNIEAIREIYKDRPPYTSLNILPFAHIYSQTTELYYSLLYDNQLALCSSKENFLKECRAVKPDVLYLVPRILDMIKDRLEVLDKPLLRYLIPYVLKYIFGGNLQNIFMGGAKLQESTKDFYKENNIIICEGYGATETSPIISVNHLYNPRDIDSVGKILDNILVEIIDGEIQVSGPSVMMGYWNDIEATKKVLVKRHNKIWYKTGDSGIVENDYLYYTGRISENYKLSNGKFVNVEMIESIVKNYVAGNIVIFGENENYNSLITEKPVSDKELFKINSRLDHYLKIKNVYTIKTDELSQFLTPKMSIKRKPLIDFIKNNKLK